MTEPENFDDELFADLYNDDEPAHKPAAASQPDHSAVQATPDDTNEAAEDAGQYQDRHHNGGESAQVKYEEEAEEEDDDIDFNLGNGPSAAATHYDEKPTYSAPPPPTIPVKGPNAKEDG
ncbi:hypothetical protein BT67DRAFT_369577 [Trichocladium antarcticum]|uniref:Uncharacterized protein n=1 Tax=Trichocladium antarcticum TaxID=1450529 RepID=A0AAN6UU18_9PEZI|nr:hypothetical protein BT67DRAFT_369577 [Trichocladium antarcticum]